jgi:hypothetical protein
MSRGGGGRAHHDNGKRGGMTGVSGETLFYCIGVDRDLTPSINAKELFVVGVVEGVGLVHPGTWEMAVLVRPTAKPGRLKATC